MTDKHLLWWVFKFGEVLPNMDVGGLLNEDNWKIVARKIEVPAWVLPALRERYEAYVNDTSSSAS